MTRIYTTKLKFWTQIIGVMGLMVLLVTLLNKIVPIDVEENGLVETFELIVMVGVLIVWSLAALAAVRGGFADRSGTVAACLGVAAIAFGGVGREVNWGRVYGLTPDWVDVLKLISAVIFLAMLATSVVLFVFVLRRRAAFVWRMLKSHASGWIILGTVMFAFGMVFEDKLIETDAHVLYEEIFETLSYLCLLIAGVVVYRYKWFADFGSLGPLAR